MKKVFTVLLSVFLLMSLLLTGCGKDEKETGGDAKDPKPTKTTDSSQKEDGDNAASKIVIFQSKVEITDQLEAAAKAYTEESGVEVEVWGTTGDDYLQQL